MRHLLGLDRYWLTRLARRFDRLDRAAADLNVVLLIFAVGLATLDFTFLVTQKIVDRLPVVTRVVDAPATAAQTVAEPQKK